MTTKDIELWHKTCENCKISKSIADQWLNTIYNKYNTEPQRTYHNSKILCKKCEFLSTLSDLKQIEIKNYLVFAIFFQYFYFDVKSDSCKTNCDAFRLFYSEANINDVSLHST